MFGYIVNATLNVSMAGRAFFVIGFPLWVSLNNTSLAPNNFRQISNRTNFLFLSVSPLRFGAAARARREERGEATTRNKIVKINKVQPRNNVPVVWMARSLTSVTTVLMQYIERPARSDMRCVNSALR